MSNRYQAIKEIQNLKQLIAFGIVPISILEWVVMYEYYLDERKSLGKMQSYSNTAENYRVHEDTIRKLVYWMETV